jgi:hypothetical protein
MKSKSKIIFGILTAILLISGDLFAQSEPSRQELENVLSHFINYRFGTVSIYRIMNPSDIKRALKSQSEVGAGIKEAEDLLLQLDPKIADMIKSGIDAGDECDKVREDILMQGLFPPPADIYDKICSGLKSGGLETDMVENAYIVTNRPELGNPPTTIIALITTDRVADDIEKNLKNRPQSEIYTYDEMKAFKLDTTFSSTNLYELVENAIMQGNIENKTLDAQGIGNPEWFAGKTYGKTSTLSANENDIGSYDVQKFLRIGDGQALDYYGKAHELVVSMDLISWKRYPMAYYEDSTGNLVADPYYITNEDLPEFGVELKYGIDALSYPSMWSERMTLSALWQSVKLGIILPTSGWSDLSESVYNINRTLTFGGVGVAAEFDFPFKVIPQSGVFHASLGYIFGDAKEPNYKDKPTLDDYVLYASDYLIRANAQLHYTFGVSIDDDYWFRFGIGGTVYSAEHWNYEIPETVDPPELSYSKDKTETIAGISGKIEFMSKNILTPFGASLQYFDEALGLKLWLEIPVIENTFALRFDASGYFTAFRDPHPWEHSSVFVPQIRFIFNF